MTTRRSDLAARMTAAAASRQAGAKPAGRTAVRTKPVRITCDLDPDLYREFKRWLEQTAETLNPDWPELTIMQAVRAMIRAAIGNTASNEAVLELLRGTED